MGLQFPFKSKFQAEVKMAKTGEEFNFNPTQAYGQDEFYKTVVKGPVELRMAVEAVVAKSGEPYLACLMGLTKDR